MLSMMTSGPGGDCINIGEDAGALPSAVFMSGCDIRGISKEGVTRLIRSGDENCNGCVVVMEYEMWYICGFGYIIVLRIYSN